MMTKINISNASSSIKSKVLIMVLGALVVTGCALMRYAYQVESLSEPNNTAQPSWDIEIATAFAPEYLLVQVTNDGSEPINILWDEWAYVDPNKMSHRILTSQARLSTSQLAQPATPVAPGTNIQERLLPAEYASSFESRTLFPAKAGIGAQWASGYSGTAGSLVGKEVGLLTVIERNGEKRKVTYRFKVTGVAPCHTLAECTPQIVRFRKR